MHLLTKKSGTRSEIIRKNRLREYIYAHAKQCRQEKDYMQEAFWYEQDLEKALRLYEAAGSNGHTGALNQCGRMLKFIF